MTGLLPSSFVVFVSVLRVGLVLSSIVVAIAACEPMVAQPYQPRQARAIVDAPGPPHISGVLEDRSTGLQFEGGQLEFELYRADDRVEQVVRNRFAVPVVLRWSLSSFENLQPLTASEGVVVLPAARSPMGAGETVTLADFQQLDRGMRYRRQLQFTARFGAPDARPSDYVYGLPYPHGLTFAVLQGFHGAFSHRGSNEYAVDFNCPVATPVVAARPGVVVAINASAQGSGTTPEFLDDRRANFVLILHDDGTLGEYMHLAPSGISVHPGQRVARGQELALSGNTGFSSTPHLHFQVMTSSEDGLAKRSFAFELAIRPRRTGPPVQGQRYSAWE